MSVVYFSMIYVAKIFIFQTWYKEFKLYQESLNTTTSEGVDFIIQCILKLLLKIEKKNYISIRFIPCCAMCFTPDASSMFVLVWQLLRLLYFRKIQRRNCIIVLIILDTFILSETKLYNWWRQVPTGDNFQLR